MAIKGTCFCGAVTYKIDGELKDAASCHCSMCRKMFSAQASAYAVIEPAEFSWQSGEHQISNYDAGNNFGIVFCSKCGSTLGGTFNGKMSWVTLGCIEGDPPIRLGKHIFVGSKASWETLPDDGVPRFAEWPTEN